MSALLIALSLTVAALLASVLVSVALLSVRLVADLREALADRKRARATRDRVAAFLAAEAARKPYTGPAIPRPVQRVTAPKRPMSAPLRTTR